MTIFINLLTVIYLFIGLFWVFMAIEIRHRDPQVITNFSQVNWIIRSIVMGAILIACLTAWPVFLAYGLAKEVVKYKYHRSDRSTDA